MARTAKLLVRIADHRTFDQLERAGFIASNDGPWLVIQGSHYREDAARELSLTLATTVAWWCIEPVAGQLTIACFHYGVRIRKLHYANAAGWSTVVGRAQPFESRMLGTWLARRHIDVSVDGRAILSCFLGRAQSPHDAFRTPPAGVSVSQTADR